MRRRRAMLVATILVTVASIVSEFSMADAKEACCAGVWKSAAVTPVICRLDETTTAIMSTDTCGPVGVGVGSGLGIGVGGSTGAADGTGTGNADGAVVMPMHAPAEHTSPAVPESPSSHAVPSE